MRVILSLCLLIGGVAQADIAPTAKLWSNQLVRPKVQSTLSAVGMSAASWGCNSGILYGDGFWTHSKQAADQIAKAWGVELDKAKRTAAARVVLGYMVRANFAAYGGDNLGVMALKGYTRPDGSPLLLFRSGVFPDAGTPGSCLTGLLGQGQVKHVINLYTGDFPLHDFIAKEAAQTKAMGGQHYDAMDHVDHSKPSWRELVGDEAHYEQNREAAMREVAGLIKRLILKPDGAAPKGNVLLHCGGGMHRSGMIYGILQKCVNKIYMPEIEADYKYHTGYVSEQQPHGYEAINVRFISEFDCKLLED